LKILLVIKIFIIIGSSMIFVEHLIITQRRKAN